MKIGILGTGKVGQTLGDKFVQLGHEVFMGSRNSTNDKAAKERFCAFLTNDLGWKTIIDLGGIESARGMEMILPLWVNLYMNFQSANFNFKIVRQK